MDVNPDTRDRLVIAVDYGTTFTGVAWKRIKHRPDPNENEEEVELLTVWPTTEAVKVPSEISYDPSPNGRRQWGFEIDENSSKFTCTKLELDLLKRVQELRLLKDLAKNIASLSQDNSGQNLLLPGCHSFEPLTVVTNFLTRLRVHLIRKLGERFGEDLRGFAIEFVISVPADWSQEATNRTFRAFVKAGFTERYFRGLQGIFMVTEPEAAALYTIQSLLEGMEEEQRNDFIQCDDCLVHVDMGGGTVDTIAYRVVSLDPILRFEKIREATGNKFGSTSIDESFLAWLKERLGPDNYRRIADETARNPGNGPQKLSRQLRSLLDDFKPIKHQYDGNPSRIILDLPGRLNDVDRGIEGGELEITNEDMQGIFRPCLERALDLVRRQVEQIGITGYETKYIFLSGGLSQSRYVYREIKRFGRERSIEVHKPERPVEAVVRGAVAKRIEHIDDGVFRMVECDKSYGICISEPYQEYLHDEEDRARDTFDGHHRAQDQMLWLIKKGDLLLSNRRMCMSQSFYRRYIPQEIEYVTRLVEYRGPDSPQRFSDLQLIDTTIRDVRYRLSDQVSRNIRRVHSRRRGIEHLRATLKAELVIVRQGAWNEAQFRLLLGTQMLAPPVDL